MDLINYLRENAGTVLFYAEQHFLAVLFAIALGSAISVAFALLVSTGEASPERWWLDWFLGAIREGVAERAVRARTT